MVNSAYFKLRMVCEPGTLNPEEPGNPDFMKSDARDEVNPLIPKLEKAGFFCPPRCTVEENSLKEWFKFLEAVRIKIQ